MTRKWRVAGFAIMAWSLLGVVGPADAVSFGDCGLPGGLHYAGQVTASSPVHTHSCGDIPLYYGWAGVNGAVQSPGTLANLRYPNSQHKLGYLNITFNQAGSFEQLGWYTGTVGQTSSDDQTCFTANNKCIRLAAGVHGYLEREINGAGYAVFDLGAWDSGLFKIVRIQRLSSAWDCWPAYINYNTLAGSACGWPSSGASVAATEIRNDLYFTVPVPPSTPPPTFSRIYMGNLTTGTNNTLRLLGASGYQDWDNVLTTQYTATFDETPTGGPFYYYTAMNPYYYITMLGTG